MSETIEDTRVALNEGYEEVVRIPAGVMNAIRASYDARDKVLDWMLAIFVAGALIYVFRGPIVAMVKPSGDPNAGKTDIVPNMNVRNAVGNGQPVGNIWTYNMPSSRRLADRVGPSSVRVPFNPSFGSQFQPEYEDTLNDAD